MIKFFILPENTDPLVINHILLEFDKFLSEVLPELSCAFNINVMKIDEGFIRDYAEGFFELREIGTIGLSKKYVGRYYISIYSNASHWIEEAIGNITKSQLIEIKEKKESGW
jgi:hypothetical protein